MCCDLIMKNFLFSFLPPHFFNFFYFFTFLNWYLNCLHTVWFISRFSAPGVSCLTLVEIFPLWMALLIVLVGTNQTFIANVSFYWHEISFVAGTSLLVQIGALLIVLLMFSYPFSLQIFLFIRVIFIYKDCCFAFLNSLLLLYWCLI